MATTVHADASSYGLGAVLLQEHPDGLHPVAIIFRTLTKSKRKYVQRNKKMPSLHLGVEEIWSLPRWTPHIFCCDRPQATCSSDKHQRLIRNTMEHNYFFHEHPGASTDKLYTPWIQGFDAVSAHILCTPYNYALCHFVQSQICRMHVCLAVTCTFSRMTRIFYVLLQ